MRLPQRDRSFLLDSGLSGELRSSWHNPCVPTSRMQPVRLHVGDGCC
jgi:hypothetical protein